jgi:hypothetical protein
MEETAEQGLEEDVKVFKRSASEQDLHITAETHGTVRDSSYLHDAAGNVEATGEIDKGKSVDPGSNGGDADMAPPPSPPEQRKPKRGRPKKTEQGDGISRARTYKSKGKGSKV